MVTQRDVTKYLTINNSGLDRGILEPDSIIIRKGGRGGGVI